MKIYKPLLLFVLFCLYFGSGVQAQLNILYDTSYLISARDTVFNLTLTSEGDCIIVGATDANDTMPVVRSEMFFLKIRGGDGDSLASNIIEFDTNFAVNDFIPTANGNYLMPGWLAYSGRIFKVDASLNIIDTCNAAGDTNYYARVIEMPNSDLVALHTNVLNKNFTNIIRMNDNWDTLWQTGYATEQYSGVVYYDNDRLIVSGWDNNNEYPHPTVTGYSPGGDFLHYHKLNEVYAFNKNIFIDTNTFILMNLKEYLLGGTVGNLIRTDDMGEYLWYEDLSTPQSIDIADLTLYNGYIITVSNTLEKDSIAFSVIDGEGALINYIKMGFQSPVLAGMERIGDQLIITGQQNDTLDTLGIRKQIFVASVLIDSSWFSVTVGKDEILFHEGVSVYPNPTSNVINITVESKDPSSEKTVLFINSSGVLVEQRRFIGNHFQIGLNQLPDGLYFVKVVMPDGRTNTQKVVLMR